MVAKRRKPFSEGQKLSPREPKSQLSVPLTLEQKAIFCQLAQNEGMCVSAWAREKLKKIADLELCLARGGE